MNTHPLRIGIYAVSGTGKSTLINRLNELYGNILNCIDGSSIIDDLVPGGINSFKKLSSVDKYHYREQAVQYLQNNFKKDNKHMVIAGHYSFLSKEDYDVAWTAADSKFYDLIIFLQAEAELIFTRCEADIKRNRQYRVEQIRAWQEYEHEKLVQICLVDQRNLHIIDASLSLDEQVKQVIKCVSSTVVEKSAIELASQYHEIIVCDCDGTLNDSDVLDFSEHSSLSVQKITDIFKKYPNGYSFDAFFEVSKYMDNPLAKQHIDTMINKAKNQLTLNSSMKASLERHLNKNGCLIMISCGYPEAWQACFDGKAYMIGGASFARYGCVITDQYKKLFVMTLKAHKARVISYGNSSSDIPMLSESDIGYFVYSDKISERYSHKLAHYKHINFLQLD
ncbi:ATP-binding protein [Orbus wheelerorum]|uniref:ATP-binding protein n=1 Tax=Orbus wheelerorum TaxID=3074111 RepID=UPI00370DB96B